MQTRPHAVYLPPTLLVDRRCNRTRRPENVVKCTRIAYFRNAERERMKTVKVVVRYSRIT